MHIRLFALLTGVGLLAVPLDAAVTARLATPADNPRADWLDGYAEARQGPEQTDRIVRVFKVGATGALDLSNISGNVEVTGGDGAEIRIEATRRVRHRDAAEAQRLLEQLRVDATQVGDRVEVRTMYPRRSGGSGQRGISARVDYIVSVPAGGAVAIKTISGNASVSRVNGEVRAESVSGDVRVTATPNATLAKTVSGDVAARDINGGATLSLGTISGSVVATGLKARSLDCGSVSGDIRLTGVQVERLQAKSVTGGIEFGATLGRGGRYEFGSHSGDVRIVLESDAGFELDASTFSGSVRSDLPVTLRPGDTDRPDRGGPNRTIRGTYGDAGAILSIKTFSGTVVISRK